MHFKLCLLLALGGTLAPLLQDHSPFEESLQQARAALAEDRHDEARRWIDRALERDAKSIAAWELLADWAGRVDDRDEQVYALHRQLGLRRAQKAAKKTIEELRAKLESVDPIAPDLLNMNAVFVSRLQAIAEEYEKAKRPHSAIRVHKYILALDPDLQDSALAIERIASAPDPSLAESAKPADLFADVSEEWIRDFDTKHSSWDSRAKVERDNYITYTDAGYRVLISAAEAMEQMNAFYRLFFQYGTRAHPGSVPRITLHIFKDRDGYLKLGIGPPVEWSGGHFTGSHVETYIGNGGFASCVTTLFHEAAHQFVSLATNAVGWLNEGLASFFEGCRILANGTVIMNLPANHRLFPLADRMKEGWMLDHADGIDSTNPSDSTPQKAPRFRTVLENRYQWGPPWYAPTWGVVFFLYNYQDPIDGRFVYRRAFREFIDTSGGRSGEGAVENFEKVVLHSPLKPTKGVESSVRNLPKTVEALDAVWKSYTLRLRDEQNGKITVDRPFLEWARHAITRRQYNDAAEHFERGLIETPHNVDLLLEFADLLAGHFKNTDRASKLVLQALRLLESVAQPDEKRIRDAEKILGKWDKKYRQIVRLREQLNASIDGLAQRYLSLKFYKMAMDVAWRFGNDLEMPGMFEYFEQAVRESGKTLQLWKLAYNEDNLEGWTESGQDNFVPDGAELLVQLKDGTSTDFRFLTMDTVTSGDFSVEGELLAKDGECAFAGLVFGRKDGTNFHSVVYRPGQNADARYGRVARLAGMELASFHGSGSFQVWRETKVGQASRSWNRLRVDVTGRMVDVWLNGELVVSHEFPSTDVLRGSFGLLAGQGEARWRNIRYLARPARDLGAQIERRVVLEKLRAESEKEGRGLGDSFVGVVPPFPELRGWVQEPRKTWEEKGNVITVLSFFSIRQNEQLPIHNWLSHMHKRYHDFGIQFVSIAAPDDWSKMRKYLERNAFPGSVGVDVRRGRGYGATFEKYLIPKFQLPRIMVLDVDQTVFWEGYPGFEIGTPWSEGTESSLDAPLEELLDKRKIRELYGWLENWNSYGYKFLRRGDMSRVAPILKKADELAGANIIPLVEDAERKLKILRSTLKSLELTARSLARHGKQEALYSLYDWGDLLEVPVSSDDRKELRKYLDTPAAKAWGQILTQVERSQKSLDERRGIRTATGLLNQIKEKPGDFAKLLALELEQAVKQEDLSQIKRVLSEAGNIPGRWLVQEYFLW
jgi:hypothetical protein